MRYVIVIPQLRVLNANAISSPYTIGFPSMTAWMGSMHALQRRLNVEEPFCSLSFLGLGVVSHKFSLDVYRDRGTYNNLLIGTGNPMTKKGERPPFIEEGKCSFTVSIAIEVDGFSMQSKDLLMERIQSIVRGSLKIAGGDVIDVRSPILFAMDDDGDLEQLKKVLMPGYLLIERKDLMLDAMGEGMDAMNAMLEYLKVFNSCTSETAVEWKRKRKIPGYIVPISVGFQRVSGFFESRFQRDLTAPHCFAESVVTLGEFIMPYKVKSLDEMLWHYCFQGDKLYLCINQNIKNKEKI
jgi:CRISPR-associated protein Csy2